ncbi:hypothetical protein SDC9_202270 [bioreactor metagenome]|uniref:Uncharacterized protein n=1 Tax=bioreactor metagenome TaxID=1076179 RepID=A0A645IVZ6_9ZZZZ
MAKNACSDIGLPAVGVNQRAICRAGNGVDGEVPSQQILFQRDLRRGVAGEAGVAVSGLALGAGEGIFLTGLRVQEDREILSDLKKSLGEHACRGFTHHHPITIGNRTA